MEAERGWKRGDGEGGKRGVITKHILNEMKV